MLLEERWKGKLLGPDIRKFVFIKKPQVLISANKQGTLIIMLISTISKAQTF
jgi:hypothetical protein